MLRGMRARFLLFVVTCVGASACAAILGIDDGIPRTQDAALDAPSSDAGADAADTAAEAAFDGPFVPLSCGPSATCNVALGQACCRSGSTTYDCIDAGVTCTGTLIQCDRPEMCPPAAEAGPVVCCADLVNTDAGALATSVSCKPTALCAYASHGWLCDDAGECPADASCLQSTFTIPPYYICR